MSFLLFALSGCTTSVDFKQGYMLRNQATKKNECAVEYPREYGTDDRITPKYPQYPPIRIQINQKPKDSVLSWGPIIIIPLPFIPWPPGIIDAFRKPKKTQNNAAKIHVVVTFYRERYFREQPQYSFNPMKVQITADGKAYFPSSYKTKTSGCGLVTTRDDLLAITIGEDSPCSGEVETDLAFDLTYATISSAVLEIGGIETSKSKEIVIPKTVIQEQSKFKLFFYQYCSP